MKKLWIALSAVLALSSLLSAQPAPGSLRPGGPSASPQRLPTRVMDPAAHPTLLKKTGGFIRVKAEGASLLFLNTQTRVPSPVVEEVSGLVTRNLRLPSVAKSLASDEPVSAALAALADTNTAAVVVIADSPGYPALLVAPENRWVLVNVAALCGTGVSDETLADRTRKEMWRAFGYLMGAAHSNSEQCLLKPVLTPADLDAFKTKALCPEPFNKILFHAQKLGIKIARTTTYRKAVEEGWAPAPTNDFQRAIWDELKNKSK